MNIRFHHIGLVIKNLELKIDWYCQTYNAKPKGSIFVDEQQKVKVQFIESTDFLIELLEPLNHDSPINSFLHEHGSGTFYHIAYEVEDLIEIEKDIRARNGLVISKTDNGWGGMEVLFALFINESMEKQIIEYVKII